MDNKRILEALQMQPLSEEEKKSRHILGRLYGPIATCKESTRNGRLYNKTLWENALKDDILKEKIETKGLFLELGHPADREETDMRQACACIPALPKIVDNDLYAYVDILDTPNGRLLKTLCDYGFVPGISSRGSGDVDDNDQVDPETFFLETWDIVQLPAVKKARLSVCESLDIKSAKLTKALVESYKKASEEDKQIMKESLENLDIKLTEEEELLPNGTPTNDDDIPWADNDELLVEAADETPEEEVEETEETNEDEDTEEAKETEEETEEDEESADDEAEDEETESEEVKVDSLETVGEIVDKLEEIEPETKVEIEPVEIDGEVHTVSGLTITADPDEDTAKIGIDCAPVEEDSEYIDEPEAEETEEVEDAEEEVNPDEEEVTEEPEDDSEEAIDNGDDEVIESLKEMIRQKDSLEKEVKTLKNAKAVGEAKEKELQEELDKYKTAFARVSGLASKATKLEGNVKELTEQLTKKDQTIKNLNEKLTQNTKLTESIDKNNAKVKQLTEQLTNLKKTSETAENELKEQLAQTAKKVEDRTLLARKYKTKFNEALTKYINYRASLLGVRPVDITSKLVENYTIEDIDKACDKLLTENVNISKLPFGTNRAKMTVKESVNTRTVNADNGYDIDDSLLELAGLK